MKKVLLIDDDALTRENVAELLKLHGFEVIVASNGKLGVAKAKQQCPDIIVCEIVIPELDGYGVLESLSKERVTKFVPFIFLSSKTNREDIRHGMDLGADDYITKPFSEDELVSAIKSRLAKKAILGENRNGFRNIDPQGCDGEVNTYNDLRKFFEDNGEFFDFEEREVIYNEGKYSNYIFLVLKGIVKCNLLDGQGKELIIALHTEDDLFGYTSFVENIPYRETATAIKNVQLVGISKDRIKYVLGNNHKISVAIVQSLAEDLIEVKHQLLQMAYSSVYKKTAATILKYAEKLNRKAEDPILISRYDLASVAGIAPETFIRALSTFKREGLIEVAGKKIRILDIQKLKAVD
ncbi:MAG TPA: response regulator [Aequorivita sp.]|nr:response regulator [Aequorivita sp.]